MSGTKVSGKVWVPAQRVSTEQEKCGESWVPADVWLGSKVPAASGRLPNSLWWPPGDHAGKMVRAPVSRGQGRV